MHHHQLHPGVVLLALSHAGEYCSRPLTSNYVTVSHAYLRGWQGEKGRFPTPHPLDSLVWALHTPPLPRTGDPWGCDPARIQRVGSVGMVPRYGQNFLPAVDASGRELLFVDAAAATCSVGSSAAGSLAGHIVRHGGAGVAGWGWGGMWGWGGGAE